MSEEAVTPAELAARLDELAHKAELKSSYAYDESDYQLGNYHRGQHDAFAWAAVEVRKMADLVDRVRRLADELPDAYLPMSSAQGQAHDIAERIRQALR